MCRLNERIHKHHLIPKYMGGPDTIENLVEVTITQHAMFHFCNYQLWGNEEDKIALKCLSGQITIDEAKREAMILGSRKGGKISGKKTYELGIGVHGRTKEEMIEHGKKVGRKAGKKAAQINKENGTGVFGLTFEERSEAGKKGALKTMENGTGLFGMSPEERSEACKKGALKSMENSAGIHSLSSKEKSEAGKKGSKNTNSQKWMCTETGFVTTPGNLSKYQRARGIDTSKRKRIK